MTGLIIFFVIAFLSGLFYPVFYAIIGAPSSVTENWVEHNFPQTQRLGITMPNMIFRSYGRWLCKMQNAWEDKHDKSRLHEIRIHFSASVCEKYRVLLDGARVCSGQILTSYDRQGDITDISQDEISGTGIECLSVKQGEAYSWIVTVKLLPGETCTVKYFDEKDNARQAYSTPLFPKWKHYQMPLSPFKAMGICPLCTMFWMLLAFLSVGCFLGFYGASLFLLFLPAYGLASLAKSLVKV